MKLGIDFGTTRIVVAAADRGNYPLVPFDTPDGAFEWLPPMVAIRGGQRLFGWSAWSAQQASNWTILRSLKRYLEDAGPGAIIDVGGASVPVAELLLGMVANLKASLSERFGASEPLAVMLGVPANANSNQRFLTMDAFRLVGFDVIGLLNEPSAASIEFGHRNRRTLDGLMLVYDLGGGTFDASLVEVKESIHTVISSEGISTLGGDDFDQILAECAVGDEVLSALTAQELFLLEEECRRQKEALHPNSRKIVIDLEGVREDLGQMTVTVSDYYQRCRPLVEETLAATRRLLRDQDIEALYVTGGGSELPLVARMLREEFGRKVKRSEYTRSATAIGLAIQADAAAGYSLRDVFARHFGVWREAEAGHRMSFDPIFPRGTRLPAVGDPPLEVRRRYRPVHNIGHFRYLEAGQLVDGDQPSGDIAAWDEIQFPFNPDLAQAAVLAEIPIELSGRTTEEEIEELYRADASGRVTVAIRNLTSGYAREFQLGRWSGKPSTMKPQTKRRSRTPK